MPTLAESGLNGFDVASWQAIYAPANTPAQFTTFQKAELVKWAKVVKDANIKPE